MDSMISTRFSGCPGSCLHETENEIFSMMVREDTNHCEAVSLSIFDFSLLRSQALHRISQRCFYRLETHC